MIASRPPGAKQSIAAGIAASAAPSSSLTAIRIPWNARVAGWTFPDRPRLFTPGTRPMAATNSRVVRMGRAARTSQMRRARRRQCRSSP